MASRLQDVIQRGLAADKPAATAVAPGTLYYSTDVPTTERSNGTVWESYADAGGGGGGGTPDPHAASHAAGGSDVVTLTQTQITGLTTSLASKANVTHASTHSSGSTDPISVTALAGYPGGTTNFLRADGTFNAPPAGGSGITQLTGDVTAGPGSGSQAATLVNTAVTPGAYTNANITVDAKGRITLAANGSAGGLVNHATTHSSGGADPVTITNLAGFSGNATDVLKGNATFGPAPATSTIRSITLVIDGGASVITTGFKGVLEIPFACTIQAVTLLADLVGSIVIDIWKDTYTNYPPVVADTITAAAKPTISAANKSQNTTLAGWTTAITAGDILGFNVDSISTIKKVTLSLKVQA